MKKEVFIVLGLVSIIIGIATSNFLSGLIFGLVFFAIFGDKKIEEDRRE